MMYRLFCSGLILTGVLCYPLTTLSADCDAPICAADNDFFELSELASEAAKEQKNSIKATMDAAADEAFAIKDQMASSSCLDQINGLDIDTKLIDPSNLAKLEVKKLVTDYIVNTGCAAITAAANEQINLVNEKINSIGSELEEISYGLVSFSSDTNSDGTFTRTHKIEAIEESGLMDDINDGVNSKLNETFFGESDPFDGNNNIDLSDDRYYEGERSETKVLEMKSTVEELEKGALCFLNGC